MPTIGIVNFINDYKLTDGSIVHVDIFDTAGQEKYKSLSDNYYKKANCCLLVYDISNRKTFEEIKNYYNPKIKENCQKYLKVILLGNKADLEKEREIPSEEASEFAMKNNYIFMESSCMTNTNVSNAFETLIEITNRESIINRIQNKKCKNMVLSREDYNIKEKRHFSKTSCCNS